MSDAPARMSVAAYRKGPGRPKERTVHVPLLTWVREHVASLVWHARNESPGRGEVGGAQDKALGVLAGVADIVGVIEYGPHAERLFGIEAKRPGSTWSDVTTEQRRFGRMLVERGGLWTWVTSVEAGQAWCRTVGIVRPRGWRAPWVDVDEPGVRL